MCPPLLSCTHEAKNPHFSTCNEVIPKRAPNDPPTISLHRCLSSACFNVTLDTSLLTQPTSPLRRYTLKRLSTSVCRFRTKKENNRRLHSLPQCTNPHPTCVRPSNTTLGGGVMPTNKRGYYNFYYFFIYYFLFYANPLLFHPSFSRPPHQAG